MTLTLPQIYFGPVIIPEHAKIMNDTEKIPLKAQKYFFSTIMHGVQNISGHVSGVGMRLTT